MKAGVPAAALHATSASLNSENKHTWSQASVPLQAALADFHDACAQAHK
jgi:hypothetical protein